MVYSKTAVYGDPVGCDRLLCLNLPAPLSQAAIPGKECSPGSGNCALKVRHRNVSCDRGNIYRVYTVIRLRGRTREADQISLLGLH